jgi:hypothetical protein
MYEVLGLFVRHGISVIRNMDDCMQIKLEKSVMYMYAYNRCCCQLTNS